MTHQARKRFGQNFLHDNAILTQIIASAQLQQAQHWVEIGPGLGALTVPLLASQVRLDVIELDRDLVAVLQNKFQDYLKPDLTGFKNLSGIETQSSFKNSAQLTIHSHDALQFDFAALAQDGEKLHIIGNLPYNVATPLLFYLLSSADCIAQMLFMLQKEVAERICAAPGSKQYGRLSVMMQYACQAEYLFDVPPESFTPIPKVMSAVLQLTPHLQPPVQIEDKVVFNQVVTAAFAQRRKTIRNGLKNLLSAEQIAAAGVNPDDRAENLSLAAFAKLSNLYQA